MRKVPTRAADAPDAKETRKRCVNLLSAQIRGEGGRGANTTSPLPARMVDIDADDQHALQRWKDVRQPRAAGEMAKRHRPWKAAVFAHQLLHHIVAHGTQRPGETERRKGERGEGGRKTCTSTLGVTARSATCAT